MGMSHLFYRLLGERMKVQGRPLLLLTTVGARTGRRRQALLGRFDDPDHPGALWVVGSNGGSAQHPGWCYNLAGNPDQVWIEVAGREMAVRARSLEGEERARAWELITSLAPGYRRYETVTDRQVPIIRLTPIE
jgi:deazaflavin-dependent oxidoreductase (nitroreductase family)